MDTFVAIPDFDGYFINKNGEILSKMKCKTGRIMKPRMEKDGYYRICLMKDKKKTYMRLNRLLALTFIPNPDNLPCVDHIDRCKTNNSISNLRWVLHSTNSQNMTRHKDNKLGHKNISLHVDKRRNNDEWYIVHIRRNKKNHTRSFKTLEEAIKYRDEYLTALGEEIID